MKRLLISLFFLNVFLSAGYAQTQQQFLDALAAKQKEAEALVEQQLKGYNEGDIEAFLLPYADSVEVYTFPNTLRYKGINKMRESYAPRFSSMPSLKATITKRIIFGNNVIDHEHIIGLPNDMTMEAGDLRHQGGKNSEVLLHETDVATPRIVNYPILFCTTYARAFALSSFTVSM